MKELILGQIPDDFDPHRHIAISPACFIGKEQVFPDFENNDYMHTIESTEELTHLDKLTSEEALFLVSSVAKRYNHENFNRYSYRFWKTIYYPFLGLLVPWLYRKQILIKKILVKYADENMEVSLIKNNLNVEFQDMLQFIIDGVWNPEVNEWVFSQILETQKPEKWEKKYKSIILNSNTTTLARFTKKVGYKASILKQFRKIFHRSSGVYGFSLWEEFYFHFLLSLKPKVKINKERHIARVSRTINWELNIESIIDKLLPESLRHLEITSSLNKKSGSGKMFNFSNRLYYDIDSKLLAAYTYESNNIVVATQHGGHNYGSALTFEYGKNIEYHSDYFISWGTSQIDKSVKDNVIPLPSPLLAKYLNTHINKSKKVILVGTDMNCSTGRFDSGPDEVTILKYRKNKLEFLKNLAINEVWYRPYLKKTTSLLDWEYVSNKSMKVKKLEGNLHADIQQCRLLILDHPGTTWNIAMAMNTPTICFWNREHFPFNKEADLFLYKFKKLSLYFDTPEEAADQVNKITKEYNDLSEWWNQKDIQDLRKEWMNLYARADKNWFWEWTKTLWNLK